MLVISETEERTTTTPNAVMASLATPSAGSTELASWRVRMAAGAAGPEHVIDREQVWMPLAGTMTVTVEGETGTVGSGQAVVLPAGVPRRIKAADGPVEVLVCMPAGGRVMSPGEPRTVPWAV